MSERIQILTALLLAILLASSLFSCAEADELDDARALVERLRAELLGLECRVIDPPGDDPEPIADTRIFSLDIPEFIPRSGWDDATWESMIGAGLAYRDGQLFHNVEAKPSDGVDSLIAWYSPDDGRTKNIVAQHVLPESDTYWIEQDILFVNGFDFTYRGFVGFGLGADDTGQALYFSFALIGGDPKLLLSISETSAPAPNDDGGSFTIRTGQWIKLRLEASPGVVRVYRDGLMSIEFEAAWDEDPEFDRLSFMNVITGGPPESTGWVRFRNIRYGRAL